VYNQGDAEYIIYNYNKNTERKTSDLSCSGYQEETFNDQLTKQMSDDSDFSEWVNIGRSFRKINNIQEEGFICQPLTHIQRDTCQPMSCKLIQMCEEKDISFGELLVMYETDVNYHGYGNYRSVVTYNDSIVAFAPIKSMSLDAFKRESANSLFSFTGQLYANEVIEGTMVNLFYNKVICKWEIATKSAIGGNYWYYRTQYDGSTEFDKQMTFRQMFMEALGEEYNSELNDSIVVSKFNVDYTYSFVLQHPNNHIVLNIKKPSVYLVAGFKIEGGAITYYTPDNMVIAAFNGSIDNLPILLPRVVDIEGKNTEDICKTSENYNTGIMLHSNITGQRIKVENVAYERLKDIRGNNPNIHYHYLSLFATGKVDEFLSEFPIYKRLFYQFYRQSYDFIKEVHDAYVSYYVKKMGKSIRISKTIFTHIYTLHNTYYIPTIDSECPTIVTRDVVSKYYNAMTPKEKLYHVSYKTREYNKSLNDGVKRSSNIISASY
jgi:hypothetical protein